MGALRILRKCMRKLSKPSRQQMPQLEVLEPRLLMSGDPLVLNLSAGQNDVGLCLTEIDGGQYVQVVDYSGGGTVIDQRLLDAVSSISVIGTAENNTLRIEMDHLAGDRII